MTDKAAPTPIEGMVVELMETWPLQLVVVNQQGRFHVALREDTHVRREDGVSGDIHSLRPGVRVRLEGNLVVVLD